MSLIGLQMDVLEPSAWELLPTFLLHVFYISAKSSVTAARKSKVEQTVTEVVWARDP